MPSPLRSAVSEGRREEAEAMTDDDHGRMLLGKGWAISCEDDG